MNIKQELSLASIELVRNHAFYGHILVQLEKVIQKASSGITTMAVGKRSADEMLLKLFVCEEFVESIYEQEDKRTAFVNMIEILKHEVLHIVFGHLAIHMPDKTRLSVAVDLAVNSYLDRAKLPKPRIPEDKFAITDKAKAGVFPEDYQLEDKKGALWYYNALAKNKEYQKQCESGAFGAGGIKSSLMTSHKLWEMAAEDPMLEDMMKDLVRVSARVCKETDRWGDVPGDLIQQLDDLCKHKKHVVPWQQVLRLFVASAYESSLSYTMKRRSRRYGTRPGTKKEDMLELAIGIDTSGSIGDEQLGLFFNELHWIEKNGASITVFECDTKIQREYKFRKFDGKAAGRGGTDLEPVLVEVEKRKFDGLIFFTDFYTPPITKHYRIPILWILSNCHYTSREEYPCKQGQFIHIDSEMNVRPG